MRTLTYCRECGISFGMRGLFKGDICDQCKAKQDHEVRKTTRTILPLLRRITALEDRLSKLEKDGR